MAENIRGGTTEGSTYLEEASRITLHGEAPTKLAVGRSVERLARHTYEVER